MKTAKYASIGFCRVGEGAALRGVQHPDGHGPNVITSTVCSYDPITGVIETANTRYIPNVAPSKLYKPAHGGYPG